MLPTMGVTAAAVLNHLKFEQILTETAAIRYDPLLREMNHAINASLRTGPMLASIRSTQQLIERTAAQFDDDFIVVVHDTRGTVLFGTGTADDAPHHPPPANVPQAGAVVHDFSDPDRFVAHMAILQDGVTVGNLSLSHSTEAIMHQIRETGTELWRAVVVALVPALPLLMLVTVVMIGHIEGRFYGRLGALLATGDFRHGDPLVDAARRIQRST